MMECSFTLVVHIEVEGRHQNCSREIMVESHIIVRLIKNTSIRLTSLFDVYRLDSTPHVGIHGIHTQSQLRLDVIVTSTR